MRRGGLMISALDSGRVFRVQFLAGDIAALTVPLSTQVYEWVSANLILGVTLR